MKHKIKIDTFALRQFKTETNKGSGGTIIDEKYKEKIIDILQNQDLQIIEHNKICHYRVIDLNKNNINIDTPFVFIDDDTEKLIKTAYEARINTELPVLTRFINKSDIDENKIAKANYLIAVLYTKEQMIIEALATDLSNSVNYQIDDFDYYVVALLGCIDPEPTPMVPITMFRNSLGVEQGGNGVPLINEDYLKSVNFWKNYVLLK